MSDEHGVSRRASLKSLGAMGAVIVLGGRAGAQGQADEKRVAGQGKAGANVTDLAVERFSKGHS